MRLLFIHGAGGGGDLWRFQTRYFADSRAVDLPGHPEGQGLESVEDYGAWVREYIHAEGLSPLVLVGHSMGGAIAQWLALHHPEELVALVLVSTGARLRVAPQIFEALAGDYEKAVDFMLDYSFGPQASLELRQEVRQLRLRVPAQVTMGDFRACDSFDLMGRVGDISLPTLVICGTEDRLTPQKYAQYLEAQLPNCRLEVIEGAGHNVMLEKPEEFNRILEDFLASLGAQIAPSH
jgi:pimeloyl-ACP methyl ester carboxylesterase